MRTPIINARGALMVVTAVLALLQAGCGEAGSERSDTPQVRPGSAGGLTAALLTTADLRSVLALPGDAAAVSLDDVKVYENPDPRGPCGAKIQVPAFARGRGVGLTAGPTDVGFEFVFGLTLSEARAYVTSVAADTRVGCPAHQSTTNTGSIQNVRLLRTVDIGRLADQRTASVVEIINEGQTFQASQVTIRDADRVAQIMWLGRISDRALRALATRAASRLQAAR